jgi:ATP-dependent helicase/nuclease subunit A
MNFTEAQRDAIESDANLVVVAGAGSGKTRVLVQRYLRLLHSFGAERILAITFTDKAAREMRVRVRAGLDMLTAQAHGEDRLLWEERRAEIEGARIGTIHSFCGLLLRAHPAETGLDPRFGVLDEVQAGLLIRDAVDTAVGQAVTQSAEHGHALAQHFAILSTHYAIHELRALLVALIRAGGEARAALATLPTKPNDLLARWRVVLAEGQSTALRDLLADPGWQMAAAELQTLESLASPNDLIGAQVITLAPLLHELAASRDAFHDYGRLGALASIKLNGGAAKNWGGSKEAVQAAKAALRALRDCYQNHVDLLSALWDDHIETQAALIVLSLATLYHRARDEYAARKDAQNVLDFDDLEALALQLLRDYPHVRARWQRELGAVLLDEFQDTNPEQRDLAYLLTGLDDQHTHNQHAPSSSNRLFIVADGKQSIYRFRGADVSVFNAARKDIVARGGREVALDTSFRAQARLIALVNHVFARIFSRNRPLQPYEVAFEPLRGFRLPAPHHIAAEIHLTPRPQRDHPLLVTSEHTRRFEGHLLARRIRALVEHDELLPGQQERLVWDSRTEQWRKPRYEDFAILFQASTSFEYYEDALRAEGVPFLTTAGRGYYGRKEVRDLIHLLRFLEDPSDDFALVAILRSPLFALDDATIVRLRLINPNQPLIANARHILDEGLDTTTELLHFAVTTLGSLLMLKGRVSVVELLRVALEKTGYLATISGLRDGERRRVNVEKLLAVARQVGAAELQTFGAYLEDMLEQEAREGEAPLEGGDVVRLMTVHRSKGLEFPIVVLPDLGRETPRQRDNLLVSRRYGLALKVRDGAEWTPTTAYQVALADEARMERAERERLLYVALTRAQDHLILAGPQAEASGENWLAWLLTALDTPWESGGPPHGRLSINGGEVVIQVHRHEAPAGI